jgi:hypothetical protein
VEDYYEQIGYVEVIKGSTLVQVQSMKNGNQCLILKPSPVAFVYLENDVCTDVSNILSIFPCPFCHRSFEPFWDCKFASYKHVYHSWCVVSHFSNSSKCLLKSCKEKVCLEWWALLSIKKPCVKESKLPTRNWIAIAHILNDLQGEFTQTIEFKILVYSLA